VGRRLLVEYLFGCTSGRLKFKLRHFLLIVLALESVFKVTLGQIYRHQLANFKVFHGLRKKISWLVFGNPKAINILVKTIKKAKKNAPQKGEALNVFTTE
jgi:hypothetical protein